MTMGSKLVKISTLLLLAFFVTGREVSIGPVADLTISNLKISPDGFERSSVVAGGTMPGPLITGYTGDRFQLNVIDNLTDVTMVRSTSIHWHGIFQNGTNWADGVAQITQCPIVPGDSFLYDFKVTGQAGTYWYHSHLSTQYCDGLRGAMVIYDPEDPQASLYDVDDENTIISLADWYHTVAPAALKPGQLPPTSDATLINGKGRYVGGPASPLSVINVEKGKRYRFRLIAMACDPNFWFSIDGHSFIIIEADGQNVLPHAVDSIQLFAGQRYSAVMKANRAVGNYWIRSLPNRGTQGFEGGINSAILRYSGAAEVDPTSKQTASKKPLFETNLHPLTSPAAPGKPFQGGADVVLNIPHMFNLTTLDYTFGGVKFKPPTVPVLLQILSGAQLAQDLLPKGSVYSLPPNKVIELSFPGTPANNGSPHPFHLHGHTFSVVRSANSTVYNYVNPVRRDVVSTGLEDSNITIRFVTDNAGPWFLHCHIDWHLELGLAIVFAEDIADTSLTNSIPKAWNDLCPDYKAMNPDHFQGRPTV